VFAAMGLYPVAGTDQWIIGTPLFPKLELQTAKGVFTIEAQNVSAENLYVQSATLDGRALTRAELTHDALTAGGKLVLVMGPSPSSWAH
jgi:putative alpha-1,2-mannosidase